MPEKKQSELFIRQAFLEGRINDPFSVLGMHSSDEGVRIRAYLPETINHGIAYHPAANDKKLEVSKSDCQDGFCSWLLTSDTIQNEYYFLKSDSISDPNPLKTFDPYSFPIQLKSDVGEKWLKGGLFDSYRHLGAHPLKIGAAEGYIFRVWAPNANRVAVVGGFNQWNAKTHIMRFLHDYGIWEIFIPEVKIDDYYKFSVYSAKNNSEVLKSDPFGFRFGESPNFATEITKVDGVVWGDDEWMGTRKKHTSSNTPISIYEIHLGSWKRKGGRPLSYFEMEKELVSYVSEMGFTHVELMPITEFPFDGSWGYQTLGLFAPTIRFGTLLEFKYLINALHRAGIGVLLDWVPAHFPTDEHGLAKFDGECLFEYADTRKGFHPDWKTLIYNYKRHEVVNFLISSACYWLEEFHIDGLRVDAVSSMLYHSYSRKPGEWEPNEFGGAENLEAIQFLKSLNSEIKSRFPDVLIFAEESTMWQGITRPIDKDGLGFDYKWNMGWMNDTLEYVDKDFHERIASHHEITHCIDYSFTENYVLPLSHDEVVHCKSSLLGKFPGFDDDKFAGLRAYYTYMWAHPGKKLLFMGNELASWDEWNFEGELDWWLLKHGRHSGVQNLVKDLNRLYKTEPALHEFDSLSEGFEWIKKNDANESIYAFRRIAANKKNFVIVVVNFSNRDYSDFTVGTPRNCSYYNVLHSGWKKYDGFVAADQMTLQAGDISCDNCFHSLRFHLPRLSTIIFKPVE